MAIKEMSKPEFTVLILPGERTKISWEPPSGMPEEQWLAAGLQLYEAEGAIQWWLGDWWIYGERAYGDRKALFNEGGPFEGRNFQTVMNYGWVANSVTTSVRTEVLSFQHHLFVASLPPVQQKKWLSRAVKESWSSNQLKAAIAAAAAVGRTAAVEFAAERLGKFPVLYADPPWRYENPPMGGSNRSIENHYPTMTLEEICALRINDIAHENAVLFMWATNPKLYECMKVLDAWGFTYRTDMVWVKDKIGMGYHVREQHESLLIAKRGELPPPPVEARCSSVIAAPRLDHSAKPPIFYDLIDNMYPGIRKIELFNRYGLNRPGWAVWGNQAREAVE